LIAGGVLDTSDLFIAGKKTLSPLATTLMIVLFIAGGKADSDHFTASRYTAFPARYRNSDARATIFPARYSGSSPAADKPLLLAVQLLLLAVKPFLLALKPFLLADQPPQIL
jgi:hypothetical protein